MKWLHFILSHSIFIAVCAVALCFQTAFLLQINLTVYLYTFIFFSTIVSYNFYWLLSGYTFSGKSLNIVAQKYYSNIIVLIIAAAGFIFSSLKIPQLWPVIAVSAGLTLLYALPLLPFKLFYAARRAGVVKTFLLAFTWAYVTVYIPYYFSPAANANTLILLFVNRFLFMLMLCIIFDARDTSVDKIRGLQSLTTILTPQTVKGIMFTIFIVYIINGIILRIYNHHDTAQIAALFITGAVTALIYFFSMKKQGYFFYYFLADGLMLFSAFCTYAASAF